MKKYEAIFILDIRQTDDEGEGFNNGFSALIEKLGGTIEKVNPMGRKQFTYEINKRNAGIYYNFVFELDPAKIDDIKEHYKLDEQILREMITIYDRPEDAIDKIAP